MTPSQIGLCLVFALSLAVGQILFKLSAIAWNNSPSNGLVGMLSPWLVAALILYGATTLLWVYILKHAPLSQAYVFSLLGAAIVPFAGVVFFREAMNTQYLLGFALALIGVFLCATSQPAVPSP